MGNWRSEGRWGKCEKVGEGGEEHGQAVAWLPMMEAEMTSCNCAVIVTTMAK